MNATLVSVFFVALGGGLGSASRFLLSLFTQQCLPTMSWIGTLSVNILGSFLIALFLVLGRAYYPTSSFFSPFFMVGLCGGFTTFSSFTLDAYKLYESGDTRMAVLYVLLSLILSCLALLGGLYVGGKITLR
ncbi:CrcB family protein [Porphyromonadaceae bacterium W3.11]|nr:CrcB family protein [Porphyromonadaceae bacterium W3.11]